MIIRTQYGFMISASPSDLALRDSVSILELFGLGLASTFATSDKWLRDP